MESVVQTATRTDFASFGVLRLFATLAAATFAGVQILHELGHLLVFALRGRSPVWGTSSIVQLSDRLPLRPEEWSLYVDPDGNSVWLYVDSLPTTEAEWVAFFLAGPAMQFLAIAVGLVVFFRSGAAVWQRTGLLLALVNSFAMALTYSVSFLRGASGDEYLSGMLLGIPSSVIVNVFLLASLSALVVCLKFSGVTRERLRVGGLLLGANVILGPAIFWTNGLVREEVDAGNALFRSLLGFSAPVTLAAFLAIAILFLAMIERRPNSSRQVEEISK